MTTRKTKPATAICDTPCPVRHIGGRAAKSLQLPRTTGQAAALDEVHRQQSQGHANRSFQSLSTAGLPKNPHGTPHHHPNKQVKQHGHLSGPFVQYGRQPPLVTQGKTLCATQPTHDLQVSARGIPGQGGQQQANPKQQPWPEDGRTREGVQARRKTGVGHAEIKERPD